MKIGVTMPSRTGRHTLMTTFAQQAEAAGFDSAWVYEVYRSPFVLLGGPAVSTTKISLGIGLAAAFTRSPFEAANAAADLDEMSDGRLLFGLGAGTPEFLSAFHSSNGRKPAARLDEYLEVVRRSWEYLASGRGERFDGEHYRFAPPPINPWGPRELPRTDIPIYLAALGPRMLDLVGRKADGWLGYFATPEFIDQRVRPAIEAGAAKAGRDASAIEITAETICCVHPDREIAMQRARRQVGFYVSHPVTDHIVALHGLEDVLAELRSRIRTEGVRAFDRTDDRLVDLLSITGTPEEARQKLELYRGHLDHIALHCPYVPPHTEEESADAFAQIISTFAR